MKSSPFFMRGAAIVGLAFITLTLGACDRNTPATTGTPADEKLPHDGLAVRPGDESANAASPAPSASPSATAQP
jgi:hypothetical protein